MRNSDQNFLRIWTFFLESDQNFLRIFVRISDENLIFFEKKIAIIFLRISDQNSHENEIKNLSAALPLFIFFAWHTRKEKCS